jgi:Zn-dependent peptidase ImmA (M78 family)
MLWDHGIAVLPLDDRGAFHAAMWKMDGRPTIVLKQKNRHSGRWFFDLLHEVWHIIVHRDQPTVDIIDIDDILAAREQSPEEIEANAFAADVLLDGRADELAEKAQDEANGVIEYLKRATINVANAERVPVSALAMHLAFRISQETELNWWGPATNLSKSEEDHWLIARDYFLEYANFSVLADVDRDLLGRALQGHRVDA